MAYVIADRVKDSTTTTGTGTIAVSGTAPTGFRNFATVASVGDWFYYCIAAQSGADWEVGIGTLVTSTTISRDVVYSSSNSNNLVSLAAGTKDVFITIPATAVENLGQIVALATGMAMP